MGTGDIYEPQSRWLQPTTAGDGTEPDYPLNMSLYSVSKVRVIRRRVIVMAVGSMPDSVALTVKL